MTRKWLAALILGLCAVQAAAADRIDRIEPQSWWVGMKHDRLQLMVHGERIAELEPSLQYAGVSIEGAHRWDSAGLVLAGAWWTAPER